MYGVNQVKVGTEEILVFPAGLDAIKNVALDASLVQPDPTNHNRRILKAGTLLTSAGTVSPTGDKQYKRYTGTGIIEGVLADDVEFLDGSSNSDRAWGMYYHGCVFRASKIVDWSLYGPDAKSTLNTCKFETF